MWTAGSLHPNTRNAFHTLLLLLLRHFLLPKNHTILRYSALSPPNLIFLPLPKKSTCIFYGGPSSSLQGLCIAPPDLSTLAKVPRTCVYGGGWILPETERTLRHAAFFPPKSTLPFEQKHRAPLLWRFLLLHWSSPSRQKPCIAAMMADPPSSKKFIKLRHVALLPPYRTSPHHPNKSTKHMSIWGILLLFLPPKTVRTWQHAALFPHNRTLSFQQKHQAQLLCRILLLPYKTSQTAALQRAP
jgi:hypothetical protein